MAKSKEKSKAEKELAAAATALAAATTDLTSDEVAECVRVLEQIVADRAVLAAVDDETRTRLLIAAGRVSRPARHELVKFRKTLLKVGRQVRKAHDLRLLDSTEMRTAQRQAVFLPPPAAADGTEAAPETPELLEPRCCYVCKVQFTKLHFFYDSMCPPCAALNYTKRFQSARLDGRVALITGARIKIGYQAALQMLRAGARVLVTTRFPRDAAARFAREADFGEWHERVSVHGLDLRHAPSVELFAQWLDRTLDRLDLLISNAAQTVRRPPAFYAHMLAREEAAWSELPAAERPLLAAHEDLRAQIIGSPELAPGTTGLVTWHDGGAGIGLLGSARLSQVPCAPDDGRHELTIFPEGAVDRDLQQVDLRTVNSWRLTLADVPTPELLEVHLVNAIAPFLLASKLKPLMMRDRTNEKHVINVSAMEAQFSRNKKTDKHPHTNMAKAALNMMTRTSAGDYAESGIWMNSVDTGWVTDEDPHHHAVRKQRVHDFHPPLDVVDGAARVCDPFFSGLLTGQHPWGKFFKDYREVGW